MKLLNKKSKCSLCDFEDIELKSHFERKHTKELNQPCPDCGVVLQILNNHVTKKRGRNTKDFIIFLMQLFL